MLNWLINDGIYLLVIASLIGILGKMLFEKLREKYKQNNTRILL